MVLSLLPLSWTEVFTLAAVGAGVFRSRKKIDMYLKKKRKSGGRVVGRSWPEDLKKRQVLKECQKLPA